MLILERNKNQALRINDNIVVYYLGINRWGNVKLGIDAPQDIRVDRLEIHIKLKINPLLKKEKKEKTTNKEISKTTITYKKTKLLLIK